MKNLEPLPKIPASASINLSFRDLKVKHVKPEDRLNGGVRVLSTQKIRDRYHMTVKYGFSPHTATLILHKNDKVTVHRTVQIPKKALKDFVDDPKTQE